MTTLQAANSEGLPVLTLQMKASKSEALEDLLVRSTQVTHVTHVLAIQVLLVAVYNRSEDNI